MATLLIPFDPLSLAQLEANAPAISVSTTTNLKAVVASFDDTTQEYLSGGFPVHPDIDTSGTVTIRVRGRSATAAASRVVAFDFDHIAAANDEDLDSFSYTTEASGDKNTINNQNDEEVHEWTETVSNLAWAAGDYVYFRISRDPTTSGTNLTGDWNMTSFEIEVPIT